MDREEIIKILTDWNFWTKEQYTGIKRAYYVNKIIHTMNNGFIVDVIGVRRSGKSTIMRQVIKELINSGLDPRDTFFVNFEDPRLGGVSSIELMKIYEVYLESVKKSKNRPYIFLDEVQRVKNWENFVRSLHERREAYIAVSGSTSRLSKGEVSLTLTGRHITTNVNPLSFSEFISFKNIKFSDIVELISKETEIKKAFLEYLQFGGFPEVVLNENKEEILLNLYNDILTRDIIERYNVRETTKLRTIAKYYLSNIGKLITLRSVSRGLNIALNTVERLTNYIKESMIITFIDKIAPSLKIIERSPRKVYAIDNGLSNIIGFRLKEELGSLLENAVLINLKGKNSGQEIYYYSGKRETDFIVVKGNNVIDAIQVSWSLADPLTAKREINGLLEAMNIFNLNEGKIITYDEEGSKTFNNRKIKILKAWKWMLELYD
ncbi:MAG: ATP-binding protein [Thermoprotei archaeon]|jgi:predicted AAA+ superfamily ATPase